MVMPMPNLKRQNRTRIEHLELVFEVYSLIPTTQKITVQALTDKLAESGTARSKRTVQRCLNIITHYFDVEKDERSIPYGYRRRQSIPFAFSPRESMLLALSVAGLTAILPPEFGEAISSTFMPFHQNGSTASPRIDVRYPRSPAIHHYDTSIFEKLSLAIYYQREIHLTLTDEPATQYVQPLGIIWESGELYLAYQHESEREVIALTDVQSVYITTFEFTYPPVFSLAGLPIPDKQTSPGT
jgi:hypothetical protein